MICFTETHICAAVGCRRRVGRRHLMCWPHWNQVHRDTRTEFFSHAIHARKHNNAKSVFYHVVLRHAIAEVAEHEFRDDAAWRFRLAALHWKQKQPASNLAT